MAGEKLGSLYEAVTKVALDQALEGNLRLDVFWHEKPPWVSIEPDLTYGKNALTPQGLLLITHSTSEKESNYKNLRNVGELFQWKVQGPKSVNVYNVIFEGKVKPEIEKLSKAVLDGSLELEKKDYGRFLINYLNSQKSAFGNSEVQREQHAVELLDSGGANFDQEFSLTLAQFSNDLKKMMRLENSDFSVLWELLREVDDRKIQVRAAKQTLVRNGASKLLLCDENLREILYDNIVNGSPIHQKDVAEYAYKIGLLGKTIAGVKLVDDDIKSVIDLLGKENCEIIITEAPIRMIDFINPLRSLGNIELFFNFVVSHYEELIQPAGVAYWLEKCFNDPEGILEGNFDTLAPQNNWLFVFFMNLEKARLGKILGYGLSTLERDTGIPSVVLRFAIPKFISREESLPKVVLLQISEAFSGILKNVGLESLVNNAFRNTLEEMIIQGQLYVMKVYRLFDPIGSLIRNALKSNNMLYTEKTIKSCLGEYAEARAATTKYLTIDGGILILWQTCLGSHIYDKTKELSARFRSTKVMWDGKKFALRPEAAKIFFVADGEWSEQNFNDLMRSGVDEIFYPDEMDKLIATLTVE